MMHYQGRRMTYMVRVSVFGLSPLARFCLRKLLKMLWDLGRCFCEGKYWILH